MIIKLSLDSETPLYRQLKDKIIYAIAEGELKQGERLPSVRQLSSSLSINLHTVSKAYTQLSNQGFLNVYKGRGAIVNSSKKYIASDDDKKNIEDLITTICAESKCRSISIEEIIKMCTAAYETFQGEIK